MHQPQPIANSINEFMADRNKEDEFCMTSFVFDFKGQPSAFSAYMVEDQA